MPAAEFGRSSIIIEDCGFRDFGPNFGRDYALSTTSLIKNLNFEFLDRFTLKLSLTVEYQRLRKSNF